MRSQGFQQEPEHSLLLEVFLQWAPVPAAHSGTLNALQEQIPIST